MNSLPSRNFQYPLSDRVGWNLKGLSPAAQPPRTFSILYRIELGGTLLMAVALSKLSSFSILYRIELGGTLSEKKATMASSSFSILYRIELGGTFHVRTDLHGRLLFQYPLSDRVGWNLGSAG